MDRPNLLAQPSPFCRLKFDNHLFGSGSSGLGFWTGDKSRQVILLSQDEEIDFHFYKSIEDSVGKTYLLEHTDVGDGIGRTTAIEDKYFVRGRR